MGKAVLKRLGLGLVACGTVDVALQHDHAQRTQGVYRASDYDYVNEPVDGRQSVLIELRPRRF